MNQFGRSELIVVVILDGKKNLIGVKGDLMVLRTPVSDQAGSLEILSHFFFRMNFQLKYLPLINLSKGTKNTHTHTKSKIGYTVTIWPSNN